MSLSNAFDPLLHDERDATDAIQNNADQPSVLPENHSSDCLTPDSASSYIETSNNSISNVHREFTFHKKGIHVANLNVRHILPKLDELQITLGVENSPDILGICETFLDPTVNDTQLYINDYDFIRKDRHETQDKSGGGLILYHRKSLKCFRRKEFEISKIETIWCEIIQQY